MSPRAGQLSAQQRRSLERDGYLLVPSLLDEAAVARMAGRLAEFVRQTVEAWDADPAPDIDDSSEAILMRRALAAGPMTIKRIDS